MKTSGEAPGVSSDPDCDSLGSAVQTGQSKSTSCFRCHPRRWRHQACCFRVRAHSHQSKTGHATSACSSKQKTSSFSRSATARISRVTGTGCNDADSDPGSILNTSNHDLQSVMPMSAVASMISSVVNQSATMAATTTGGNVPQTRNTFGKRNIKNQVNYYGCILKSIRLNHAR